MRIRASFLVRHARRWLIAISGVAFFLVWLGVWVRVLPVRPRLTLQLPPGHIIQAVSQDGRRLLAVETLPRSEASEASPQYYRPRARVFDLVSGAESPPFSLPLSWRDQFEFSPDGSRLLVDKTAGWRSDVSLVDVEAGKVILHVRDANHTRPCFSPDSRHLVVPIDSRGFRLCDAKTGETLKLLAAEPTGRPRYLGKHAFSEDTRVVAISFADDDRDYTVEFWELKTRGKLSALSRAGPIMALSPRGDLAAVTAPGDSYWTAQGPVRLIDTATGRSRLPLEGLEGEIETLFFSRDGKSLTAISRSDDRAVCLTVWQVPTGRIKLQDTGLRSLWPIPSSQWRCNLIISETFGPTDSPTATGTRVFDPARCEWRQTRRDLTEAGPQSLSHDGQVIVLHKLLPRRPRTAGEWVKQGLLDEAPDGQREWVLQTLDLADDEHAATIRGVERFFLSDDGKTLVTDTAEDQAHVWDLPLKRPVASILLLAALPSLLLTTLLWWRWGR